MDCNAIKINPLTTKNKDAMLACVSVIAENAKDPHILAMKIFFVFFEHNLLEVPSNIEFSFQDAFALGERILLSLAPENQIVQLSHAETQPSL